MDLFGLYAERMVIENELGADISGFHLNALSSGLPLKVNLDTTLNVLAGNCYRLLARNPPRRARHPRTHLAALPRRRRDGARGKNHVRVDLALRTYTPVLIDAGVPELELGDTRWEGRRLRIGFPPR